MTTRISTPKVNLTVAAMSIFLGAMLVAIACSSGSSPTEPSAASSTSSSSAAAGSSDEGVGSGGTTGADISIEKSTNGEDADGKPGPTIAVGDPVEWLYEVTNTGKITLHDIVVTDDLEGDVKCPKTKLESGESMKCRATGKAIEGPYENVGSVVGVTAEGDEARDKDESHYTGGAADKNSSIRIEKSTNGEDADGAPGPEIEIGTIVEWTYEVTNTGETTLEDLVVTDNQGVTVLCALQTTTLLPGQTLTCSASGEAVEGQYENVGLVSATSPSSETIRDKDPSHYFGTCVGVDCDDEDSDNDSEVDSDSDSGDDSDSDSGEDTDNDDDTDSEEDSD